MAVAAEQETVLRVDGVWKSFGKLEVLKGVSLSVRRGEAVAVVGENGSGKSVLLKTLVGLERPDRGSVVLNGTIGYCPQSLDLFDGLTVSEHFVYYGAAYGLSTSELEATANEYLQAFRFDRFLDTLVRHLSGGTKQKLNLALSLLHSPDIVLLDEPYQGFDYETFLSFAGMVDHWRGEGKAVLTISHLVTGDLNMNRVLELRDGVVHEQPPVAHRL